MKKSLAFTLALFSLSATADLVVPMNLVDAQGTGTAIGEIVISESDYGLVFTPDLTGLSPGVHGFHIHENGSCGPKVVDGKTVPAGAAGGHYDPENTKVHDTPWGKGHKGDLPALYVDHQGKASQPVLAPRLKKTDEIKNRAIMIHVGGDNHSDHPAPLGGGGARMACGVIR